MAASLITAEPALHRPRYPVRLVTATALFDGHDAAINMIRRLLQRQGAEVIHLGHNRSVDEIAFAAIQEDVTGVAVSSYQGGHMEFFTYLIDRLAALGRSDIRVYGGGGGVIIPSEIAELEAYGMAHVFSPEDGQRLGLDRMINQLVLECDFELEAPAVGVFDALAAGSDAALARVITALENSRCPHDLGALIDASARSSGTVVLGITGTGGSGKSSLTDELIHRFRLDQEDKLRIAVLAVDPTKSRGGGALLGDRIRMNALAPGRVFFRSMATRGAAALPAALAGVVDACRCAAYDLVIVETPGMGQGQSDIADMVDASLYVMTPEFGAASQLEKIDMLELADVVAVNKFERRGAEDALREVRRLLARDPARIQVGAELPVFGTIASRFDDDGVTALYQYLRSLLAGLGLAVSSGTAVSSGAAGAAGAGPRVEVYTSTLAAAVVPPGRSGYLDDVARVVRSYHAETSTQADLARQVQQADDVAGLLGTKGRDASAVLELAGEVRLLLSAESRALLSAWPETKRAYSGDEMLTVANGREHTTALTRTSLSGTKVAKVALPRTTDHADLLTWLRAENLPGHFPYTAGVFAFRREQEDPARMFAGEGDAFRTNRRFRLLAEGQPATRLSTAFDSVTLYGFNPDERPDIHGKIGNAGVSIATLDDMKVLYDGFDLCDPATSVSMTINGPAPTILAMFLNTALDQQRARFVDDTGREPSRDEDSDIRRRVLGQVRGTVQADILKEDQGQNTCIFSTEFSLRVMADMAQWFIDNEVRNFYSVSISGYHIAEAGANPITQLAFTLANGFTYVEAYLARGMAIDDFAPSLSFFFSNGMDPEYTVIGRVARRIWALAMRDRYGAGERSQKLKYHVQTSGRSLHAQEMAFNDIRTTLQALCAIYDNANSLHTNAFDEAVTTPTDASVRRALAIQMVINKEWGLAGNENPNQGSFIVAELTDLVEEAVLVELERLSRRGGVLGAMETGYQRGRIQDESLLYEQGKHDGSLPIVGVNTFLGSTGADQEPQSAPVALARSTEAEKQSQLDRLHSFEQRHSANAPEALARLRDGALAGDNIFALLMEAVRFASLGQITSTLFDAGGQYRRNL